jgi:hypothetical protein
MKVAVCMPSRTGDIPEYLAGFLFGLGRRLGAVGAPAVFWVISRALQDTANNAMSKACLEDPEVTHILWIEDDMGLPPDLFERLFAHDVDMVSATFYQRNEPYQPHAYRRTDDPDGLGREYYRPLVQELLDWEPGDGLVEVDSCGFGAVLMKRHVLERVYNAHEGIPFRRQPEKSVDFDFCEKARAEGITIHVDFGLHCDHEVFRQMVGPQHFQHQYAALKKEKAHA